MSSLCENPYERVTKIVSKFIKILRSIYKDLNRDIYASLGKPFQKSVLKFVNIIPKDWIHGLLRCLEMLYGMAQCVDFDRLAEVLHKNVAVAWAHINSKRFVFDAMRGYCTVSVSYEKAAENILENFDPIFNAIDYIFGHEVVFVDQVAKVVRSLRNEDPLRF